MSVTDVSGLAGSQAPTPVLGSEVDSVLADTCHAAVLAVNRAWAHMTRDELVSPAGIGADGTPTYRIDEIVDEAVVRAANRHGVNVLSEESGLTDVGSAITLVVDPLDGSANAAAGVPMSCFSAALFREGEPYQALTWWLEGGRGLHACAGTPTPWQTSGRTRLDGAAVGLLRPKQGEWGHTMPAWTGIAERAGRVRILSTSCLEAMLVAWGSVDAFVDPGSQTHRLMDLAAAMVFMPAAGGVVLDAFGSPLEYDENLRRRWSGVVAASRPLAEELAEVIVGHQSTDLGTVAAAGHSLRLRRAKLADVPRIVELLNADAMGDLSGEARDLAALGRAFERIDRSHNDLLGVVLAPDGGVIGTWQVTLTQGLGYDGLLRATFEGFAIDPAWRSQGVGQSVVRWVLGWCRRRGAQTMQLSSNLKRERAIALYERLGFQHTHAGLKFDLTGDHDLG